MTLLRRLGRVIVHNWPLKLAAVAVATLLYAGLVLSQNAQRWDGQVAIQPRNIPASAVLISPVGNVTEIRYFAPSDVAARVSSQTFSASVDLTTVDPKAGPQWVNVHVTADPRITIVDFQPTQVRVELDPLITRSVPVQVDFGSVPQGIQIGQPQLSDSQVVAAGPESVVDRVAYARAPVVVQPSGLRIDQDVSLLAVDAAGVQVTPVDLRPATIHVQISVGGSDRTRTLPVNAITNGDPANGYLLQAINVEPAIVTVSGNADTLEALDKIDTAPISMAGATTDVGATVPLALPPGVSAVGAKEVTVRLTIVAVKGTRTFSAGIVLSGARDDRTYALSTDQVTVTLGGPIASLDSLDPSAFTVTADVGALAPGSHTVPLGVNLPAGVTVRSIDPAQVGVTVAVAASPSPSPSPIPSASPS